MFVSLKEVSEQKILLSDEKGQRYFVKLLNTYDIFSYNTKEKFLTMLEKVFR